MAFNRKAAVAASIATMCILSGTMALAQSNKAPHSHYIAVMAPVAAAAS